MPPIRVFGASKRPEKLILFEKFPNQQSREFFRTNRELTFQIWEFAKACR